MTFFVVTLSVLVIYLLILVMVQKKIISMLKEEIKKLSVIDLDKEVDNIIDKMNKDISVEIGDDVNVKDNTSHLKTYLGIVIVLLTVMSVMMGVSIFFVQFNFGLRMI